MNDGDKLSTQKYLRMWISSLLYDHWDISDSHNRWGYQVRIITYMVENKFVAWIILVHMPLSWHVCNKNYNHYCSSLQVIIAPSWLYSSLLSSSQWNQHVHGAHQGKERTQARRTCTELTFCWEALKHWVSTITYWLTFMWPWWHHIHGICWWQA